jgi:hypothetical protein
MEFSQKAAPGKFREYSLSNLVAHAWTVMGPIVSGIYFPDQVLADRRRYNGGNNAQITSRRF